MSEGLMIWHVIDRLLCDWLGFVAVWLLALIGISGFLWR